MDWKTRAKEILQEKYKIGVEIPDGIHLDFDYLYNSIEELLKEVHDKACEEQKKIDSERALIVWESFIDKDSILNSPNANFE